MPKELKLGFLKIGRSGFVIIVKDCYIPELTVEREFIQKEMGLMFQLLVLIVITQLVILLN
jgi:hypothetical protein